LVNPGYPGKVNLAKVSRVTLLPDLDLNRDEFIIDTRFGFVLKWELGRDSSYSYELHQYEPRSCSSKERGRINKNLKNP
jgi:hypothetical protein